MVDAQLLPPLINLLSTAEFDIKKEAAWAVSNATSGGSADQIRLLVQYGCIKPLCELLTVADARIVTVALEGLENILKVGLFSRHHTSEGPLDLQPSVHLTFAGSPGFV